MPCVNQHRRTADKLRDRCGYTLLELLIALGILAAIAGLTLPALRGPLDKSRLRYSAREVQSALTKTRALAIRAGEAHSFRYEIGGRNFRIETTDPSDVPATADGLLDTETLPGEANYAGEIDAAQVEPVLRTVRAGQLPDGVVFAVPATQDTAAETTEALAIEQLLAVAMADTDSNAAMLSHWSEPVRLSPNGRATDATIRMQGSRDFHIDVSLRGLTGIASYSSPQRAAVTPNASAHDATSELALNPDANSGGRK
jgi:prepilin-type N-terminal cleavage/methylation domain-containing protein